MNEHDRARLYFLQMDLLGSVRHLTFYFSSDGRNIISAMATKKARNISNCRLRDEFNLDSQSSSQTFPSPMALPQTIQCL